MSKALRKKLAGSLKLSSLTSSNSQTSPPIVPVAITKQPSVVQVAAPVTTPIIPPQPAYVDDTEPDTAIYEDAQDALLHPDTHEEGGLGCSNKATMESQRGVITDLVKQIGRQLLAGKLNLINVSLPVKIFEPRSYLEKLADVWVYPQYLKAAAQTSDPVERMKLVVTFFIAGIHLAFITWRKPFNPILGETWQASLEDGTRIFLEQVSHHPPVSAFEMVGPQDLYTFSGLSQPEVQAKLQSNAIKTTAKGYRCVTFQDGGAIQIVYPTYLLKGILYGQPKAELVGKAEFIDQEQRLVADVTFGEIKGATHPLLQRPDTISCTIRKQVAPTTDDAVPSAMQGISSRLFPSRSGGKLHESTSNTSLNSIMATGQGNWLAFLDWEGTRYWTMAGDNCATWHPASNPLPSDVRYREDLQELHAGRVTRAQEAKEWMENVQRRDKKLRAEAMGGQKH